MKSKYRLRQRKVNISGYNNGLIEKLKQKKFQRQASIILVLFLFFQLLSPFGSFISKGSASAINENVTTFAQAGNVANFSKMSITNLSSTNMTVEWAFTKTTSRAISFIEIIATANRATGEIIELSKNHLISSPSTSDYNSSYTFTTSANINYFYKIVVDDGVDRSIAIIGSGTITESTVPTPVRYIVNSQPVLGSPVITYNSEGTLATITVTTPEYAVSRSCAADISTANNSCSPSVLWSTVPTKTHIFTLDKALNLSYLHYEVSYGDSSGAVAAAAIGTSNTKTGAYSISWPSKLTITANGSGRLRTTGGLGLVDGVDSGSNPPDLNGLAFFSSGINLEATPSSGNYFVSWEGYNCSGVNYNTESATCIINNVAADRSIIATFAPIGSKLSALIPEPATGTNFPDYLDYRLRLNSPVDNPDGIKVRYGNIGDSLSCSSGSGSLWQGNTPSEDSGYDDQDTTSDLRDWVTFTKRITNSLSFKAIACRVGYGDSDPVEVNYTLTAPTTYTITANEGTGGTATADPTTVSSGGSSTLTATPSNGYTFSGWSGDCSGTTNPIILSSITSNKTCTASFTASGTNPDDPTVTISSPSNSANISGSTNISATTTSTASTRVITFQYKPSTSTSWTTVSSDSTSPYTVSWNTTALVNGSYSLRALLSDNDVTDLPSSTITVNVQNAGTITKEVTTSNKSSNVSKIGGAVIFNFGNTSDTKIGSGFNVTASEISRSNAPAGKSIVRAFDLTTDQSDKTGYNATIALSYPAGQTYKTGDKVMYWDTTSNSWSENGITNIPGTVGASNITFNTTHFTEFAILTDSSNNTGGTGETGGTGSTPGTGTTGTGGTTVGGILPTAGSTALNMFLNFILALGGYLLLQRYLKRSRYAAFVR